jgi:CheY-like chemotaxis protein
LVDDQPYFLAAGRQMLQGGGFAVQTAASGAEALELARTASPDLVLLDVQMPGMDGFTTCQRLKANPATAAIPVVMITATEDPTLTRKAFKAGADATISKSVGAERLLNMLQVTLATARAAVPPSGPQ